MIFESKAMKKNNTLGPFLRKYFGLGSQKLVFKEGIVKFLGAINAID